MPLAAGTRCVFKMNVMDDGGVVDDSFTCDDEVKAMTTPGGSASGQQLAQELEETMLQQALAHVYQVGRVNGTLI